MVRPSAIPVTVIGGFLGAGKTTLVNHVLQGDHGLKIAVLVNDFGAVNIDAALITSSEGGVYSLANGCVCCGLNQGLVEQLEELLERPGSFDHMVIEASGVADPARIMDTVRYARFAGRLQADAVVVLVDLAGFDQAMTAAPGLAETQLDAADLVVLNKADLVPLSQIEAWRKRWQWPGMRVITAVDARVPFDFLFAGQQTGADRAHDHAHAHEQPVSRTWRSSAPVDLEALAAVLKSLPPAVYRAKGFVRDSQGRQLAVQVVGTRVTVVPVGPGASSVGDGSILVLIGFGADADFDGTLARLDACASPSR